jgi:hypothetical protein
LGIIGSGEFRNYPILSSRNFYMVEFVPIIEIFRGFIHFKEPPHLPYRQKCGDLRMAYFGGDFVGPVLGAMPLQGAHVCDLLTG